jgi:hypothetical protein
MLVIDTPRKVPKRCGTRDAQIIHEGNLRAMEITIIKKNYLFHVVNDGAGLPSGRVIGSPLDYGSITLEERI